MERKKSEKKTVFYVTNTKIVDSKMLKSSVLDASG